MTPSAVADMDLLTKNVNEMAMKPGDRIKIIRMDDSGGKDWQATRMNGKICTVRLIDSIGQIHLEGYGLAVIPGLDEFIVVESTNDSNS